MSSSPCVKGIIPAVPSGPHANVGSLSTGATILHADLDAF